MYEDMYCWQVNPSGGESRKYSEEEQETEESARSADNIVLIK